MCVWTCCNTTAPVLLCLPPCCVLSCRLGLTMSWLLAMWISLGFLLLCQATLYQTIQQHHVARPGRTDILTLGMSASLSHFSFTVWSYSTRCCSVVGAVLRGFWLFLKRQQDEAAAVSQNDLPQLSTVTWWFTMLTVIWDKQRGRLLIVPLIACYILLLSHTQIYLPVHILHYLWK